MGHPTPQFTIEAELSKLDMVQLKNATVALDKLEYNNAEKM